MDGCKDLIINEFEKKSGALIDYLNSLEAAFERQRVEFEHREAQWKREKGELKYMLETALERAHRLEHEKSILLKEKDRLLLRVQELEHRVEELVSEMQRKEELYNFRKKREERIRRKLEMDNKNLKKKATVGWMLGSLCEVYLEGGADGGTLPLILMLRKLQKDLEKESSNIDIGLKISTDSIKKEVNKLLSCSTSRSRSPRVEVRVQGSRAGSVGGSDDDDYRRKPYRSQSPKQAHHSPSCSRSPYCPRDISRSPQSPCSPRPRSPTSPRATSPIQRTPRSPYSAPRARSPLLSRSASPCSKTKSRSPSPCTTLTVNFDSDMPEEPATHFRCSSQAGGTVEISKDDGRKKIKITKPAEEPTDIKHMLSNIEANINYLLDSERKRRWRESQFKSLNYTPRSKTPWNH